VIGMIRSGLSETEPGSRMIAFRQGLNESGYIEGQNVTIESRWAEGPQDRYSDLVADLIRRKVSVIATGANTPASLAAKAATSTIPIVFGVGQDPVMAWSKASLDQEATRRVSISSSRSWQQSGLGCCAKWYPGWREWPF